MKFEKAFCEFKGIWSGNKIDMKEVTRKPSLTFNWVMFLGDFSV